MNEENKVMGIWLRCVIEQFQGKITTKQYLELLRIWNNLDWIEG